MARLDPAQPIFDVRPLEDLLDTNSAPQRLNAFLTSSFALLALALGAVGVAGVVSYSVIRRTPEMAIRMALGATPKRVVRSVTASGLRVCLIGLVAGLAGASVLGRLMARLLYQVRPDDPVIFGAVAAVLLGGRAAVELAAGAQDCPYRSGHRTPQGMICAGLTGGSACPVLVGQALSPANRFLRLSECGGVV